MNKPWKVILVFIGVFLFGGITGSVITLRFHERPIIRHPNFERFAKNRVMHLTKVLKCSPDQSDKLQVIVLEASMNLRRVRQNSIRQVMTIFDHMDSRIETVLNPEQRTRFEQIREMERQRIRGFMHHPPPGTQPGDKSAPNAVEHKEPPQAAPKTAPAKSANQPQQEDDNVPDSPPHPDQT